MFKLKQTMPTNILDEALNEAESFVDEQIQKQQTTGLVKQKEEEEEDGEEEVKKKKEEEDEENKKEETKEEEEENKQLIEENKKGDKTSGNESSLLEIEQMRSNDDDDNIKDDEKNKDEKSGDGGEEFQLLSDDLNVDEQGEKQKETKEEIDQLQKTEQQPSSLEVKVNTIESTSIQTPSITTTLAKDEQEKQSFDSQLIEEQQKMSSSIETNVEKQQNGASSSQNIVVSTPNQQQQHSYGTIGPSRQFHYSSHIQQQSGDNWCDVATLNENKCLVTQYLAPMDINEQQQFSQEQGISPSTEDYRKIIGLEPGFVYRFRVCAFNSVGQSKWSPINSFRTCIPGFPGAPSSIKITKGADGAIISWEPPQTTNGDIIEYSVYLAMRSASYGQPAFVPVYVGPAPNCMVNHQNLQLAHIDTTPKPAIIFRIAARNEKGYGPATQVRWLQDQRPMAVMPPLVPPTAATAPPSQLSSTAYQQSSSPNLIRKPVTGSSGYSTYQQQQQIGLSERGYYPSTGTRRVLATSSAIRHRSPSLSSSSNVAMVQPQYHSSPSARPSTSSYDLSNTTTSSSSPQPHQQRRILPLMSSSSDYQYHLQMQQQHYDESPINTTSSNSSSGGNNQFQQEELTYSGGGGGGLGQQPQQLKRKILIQKPSSTSTTVPLNPGLTVREYLTSGTSTKRIRLEQ